MGKKHKDDITCEIIDIIDVLEQGKSDWAKVLMKVSWNDAPPVHDIRGINMATVEDDLPKIGKGITLSDEALERLTLAALKEGFVSTDDLLEIIESREGIFKQPKHKIKIKRKS